MRKVIHAYFTPKSMEEWRPLVKSATNELLDVAESRGDGVDLMRDLVGETPVDVVAYGTEAGLFQTAGVPAVVWGPGDIGVAHRPDEFVDIADLTACLEVLQRLPDRQAGSTQG